MSRPLLAAMPLLALCLASCDAFPSYPEYPGMDTAPAIETGDSDGDYSDYEYEYEYDYSYYDYYDYNYDDYYNYYNYYEDTAIVAVAFYLDGMINVEGELYVMDALWGIQGYGVDGGYVDYEDHLCSWYAFNTAPALPTDCPQCTFAFALDLTLAGETGEHCEALVEGLGPYGYTGPEFFIRDVGVGFVPSGVATDDYGEYEYGYLAIYLSYPDYTWYNATSYSASLRADPESGGIQFDALNGYYGVTWTP